MKGGRERQHPKRRDREVLGLDDFIDADLAAIAEAKAPDEYAALDDELKNWKP
jgi:hypothetical protein